MRLIGLLMACVVVLLGYSTCFGEEPGFTREDRDRLIRLEATLQIFMEQVDKRFEDLRHDMNRRFEQVDRRFEQVDKRFEDLRHDMNRRFEQLITFLWILVGVFTTLTATVIAFAYWDRRTIIRKARDEAIEAIEKEGRLRDLIGALRTLASEDPRLTEVLRRFHLL